MLRKAFLAFIVPALAVTFVGCGETETAPASSTNESGSAVSAVTDEPEGEDDVVAKEMAKLSEADREAAMAQKVCPVGGELGSMGPPIKVTLDDGREFFVCCEGCSAPLKADPEKYLAKLEEAKAE